MQKCPTAEQLQFQDPLISPADPFEWHLPGRAGGPGPRRSPGSPSARSRRGPRRPAPDADWERAAGTGTARELFRPGRHAVARMEEIAEATGLGRGCLYGAFGGWQALFRRVFDDYCGSVVRALRAMLERDIATCRHNGHIAVDADPGRPVAPVLAVRARHRSAGKGRSERVDADRHGLHRPSQFCPEPRTEKCHSLVRTLSVAPGENEGYGRGALRADIGQEWPRYRCALVTGPLSKARPGCRPRRRSGRCSPSWTRDSLCGAVSRGGPVEMLHRVGYAVQGLRVAALPV